MAIDVPQITKFFEPIHPSGAPTATSPSFLPEIVFFVVYLFLTIAGIVTTIAIIYGGILYITSAGDEAKAGKGRAAIINGVIGSIIVILSAAAIRSIQKVLG